MKTIILNRYLNCPNGNVGVLNVDGVIFATLERPWRYNRPMVSCIPVGEYECVWTHSKKFPNGSFQLLNVPERGGIRIHSGNLVSHVNGCVMLGSKVYKRQDGLLFISNSKQTVRKFEALLNKSPFKIIVTDSVKLLASSY